MTGASAGIGTAFARLLADEGFDLVLVARRKERLEVLARELAEVTDVKCHVLAIDLAEPSSAERVALELDERGIAVDVLIANAGFGLSDGFVEAPWRAHAEFIQVMATGVVELCHRFVPGMIERGWGRIINVSSLAAFAPEVPGSLYGAVKTFVIRFSEALSLELAGSGVLVTALCPGYTITEFHDVIDVRAQIDALPSYLVMDAEAVVREGWEAVQRGEPVRINGRLNRMLAGLMSTIPNALVRAIISGGGLRASSSSGSQDEGR